MTVSPRWALAANVVDARPFGPGSAETRSGTRHFRAGANVLVFGLYAGMCENVAVVGRHRGSQRYVAMIVRAHHLRDFRPKLVYSPTVLRLMEEFDTGGCVTLDSEANAQAWAIALPQWGRHDDGT